MSENQIIHGLDHEIDCNCPRCWIEFLPIDQSRTDIVELRAKKVVELAEQLGGFINYVQGFLEELPRYDQNCDCIEKEILRFGEIDEIPETTYQTFRTICCRCGGKINE